MEEKIYFLPGDTVILKQDVPNKPVMIVKKKATKLIKGDETERSFLQGIVCFWFTEDGYFQEETFNTKDLLRYE